MASCTCVQGTLVMLSWRLGEGEGRGEAGQLGKGQPRAAGGVLPFCPSGTVSHRRPPPGQPGSLPDGLAASLAAWQPAWQHARPPGSRRSRPSGPPHHHQRSHGDERGAGGVGRHRGQQRREEERHEEAEADDQRGQACVVAGGWGVVGVFVGLGRRASGQAGPGTQLRRAAGRPGLSRALVHRQLAHEQRQPLACSAVRGTFVQRPRARHPPTHPPTGARALADARRALNVHRQRRRAQARADCGAGGQEGWAWAGARVPRGRAQARWRPLGGGDGARQRTTLKPFHSAGGAHWRWRRRPPGTRQSGAGSASAGRAVLAREERRARGVNTGAGGQSKNGSRPRSLPCAPSAAPPHAPRPSRHPAQHPLGCPPATRLGRPPARARRPAAAPAAAPGAQRRQPRARPGAPPHARLLLVHEAGDVGGQEVGHGVEGAGGVQEVCGGRAGGRWGEQR